MRLRYPQLWLAVGLLLVYWVARLVAIAAFPPFIDEAFHINFGRNILLTGPLAHSSEGRQFVVWLYILFNAQANEPYFMARVANLLMLLPSCAALLGVARLLSSYWGAFFAALFLITSPYHHFFERLALADPPSASAVMLAVYFAARLHRRASYADAVLCGIALFIACGAKVSALPYFAIPVIAAIAFKPNRKGIQWAATALSVGLSLTGLYLTLIIWRGYNPFFYLATPSTLSRLQILLNNVTHTGNTLIGYFGIPLTLLLVVAVVSLLIRRRFFLPLCLVVPLLVLWLSPRQDSRHLVTPVTLLLLCGAVTFGDLLEQRQSLRLPVLAAGIVWGLVLWLPFAWNAAHSPAALALPADDHLEYRASEASGFGLAELIDALNQHQPARVIGILANCLTLRDLAPFLVECPHLNPNGEDVPALTQLLDTSRVADTYAVLEDLAYAPANAPGTLVTIIDAERPRLSVYDLAP